MRGLDETVFYRAQRTEAIVIPELFVGDFDGDRQNELASFSAGVWWVDTNHNGRQDPGDTWVRMAGHSERGVVDDFDGDGKDEIGVRGANGAVLVAEVNWQGGIQNVHDARDADGALALLHAGWSSDVAGAVPAAPSSASMAPSTAAEGSQHALRMAIEARITRNAQQELSR